MTRRPNHALHSNPAGASRLPSLRPVRRVAELGSRRHSRITMKMQNIIPIVLLVGCCAVSAQTTNAPTKTNNPSSSRHLTEAQAIALAKPKLHLPAGESYRTAFRDGMWEVWTDRNNSQFRSWRVVTIRDSDGKVQGVANRF